MAIDNQQARYLAQRSEQGYVSDLHLALRDEPEAVSEVEQREITRRAARLAELRRVEAWRTVRCFLVDSLADFEPYGRTDRAISEALRGIRRDIGRIDRRVGAG